MPPRKKYTPVTPPEPTETAASKKRAAKSKAAAAEAAAPTDAPKKRAPKAKSKAAEAAAPAAAEAPKKRGRKASAPDDAGAPGAAPVEAPKKRGRKAKEEAPTTDEIAAGLAPASASISFEKLVKALKQAGREIIEGDAIIDAGGGKLLDTQTLALLYELGVFTRPDEGQDLFEFDDEEVDEDGDAAADGPSPIDTEADEDLDADFDDELDEFSDAEDASPFERPYLRLIEAELSGDPEEAATALVASVEELASRGSYAGHIAYDLTEGGVHLSDRFGRIHSFPKASIRSIRWL